jgi:hypothetical protein
MRWTLGAIQSLYIVDVLDHVSSSSFLNEVDAELPEPPGNRMRGGGGGGGGFIRIQ